jgi:glycosyltransferase involved in cell wall biosynthesis
MRALHRVLMDRPLRERMKERGYQQAKKFSWDKSVRRILDAYHEIAEEGDPQAGLRSRTESTLSS